MLSIDSVGTRHPKIPQTKTGAEAETHHPSQSEGSIPVGSSRGILKGGTIRAGASCSPLEPDNFPYFLAGARKYGRRQAVQANLTIAPNERSSRHRYPPASTTPEANRNCTARWLPQTRLTPCQLPPGGSHGLAPFHIGFLRMRSACCESLSHASGVPAPTGREPFCARYRRLVRLTYSLKKEPPNRAALAYVGDLGITPGKP